MKQHKFKISKELLFAEYGKNIYNKKYWDKYLTWTKQNL